MSVAATSRSSAIAIVVGSSRERPAVPAGEHVVAPRADRPSARPTSASGRGPSPAGRAQQIPVEQHRALGAHHHVAGVHVAVADARPRRIRCQPTVAIDRCLRALSGRLDRALGPARSSRRVEVPPRKRRRRRQRHRRRQRRGSVCVDTPDELRRRRAQSTGRHVASIRSHAVTLRPSTTNDVVANVLVAPSRRGRARTARVRATPPPARSARPPGAPPAPHAKIAFIPARSSSG